MKIVVLFLFFSLTFSLAGSTIFIDALTNKSSEEYRASIDSFGRTTHCELAPGKSMNIDIPLDSSHVYNCPFERYCLESRSECNFGCGYYKAITVRLHLSERLISTLILGVSKRYCNRSANDPIFQWCIIEKRNKNHCFCGNYYSVDAMDLQHFNFSFRDCFLYTYALQPKNDNALRSCLQ